MSHISDTAVINAEGGLVELGYDELTSNVTVTATTAATGHIIGDVTFVSDGSPVYVQFDVGAMSPPTGSGELVHFALEVDGSVTKDYWCSSRNVAAGGSYLDQTVNNVARLSLSAGSHNVKIRAFGNGSTGVINASALYGTPLTRVSKVVTASEWPAINEQNRIICTSSTRPSAPYEGIEIYETDTGRAWEYNGTAWVPEDRVFTNEAARDAAITSPRVGERVILTSPTGVSGAGGSTYLPSRVTTMYNGTSWSCMTPVSAFTNDSGTINSGSYSTSLSGSPGTNPSVTLVTGSTVLVEHSSEITAPSSGVGTLQSVGVSGATTIGPDDHKWIGNWNTETSTVSKTIPITYLNPGSNTFYLAYRHGGTTGGTVGKRRIVVWCVD